MFRTSKGTAFAHGNIRNRILIPLLARLGIPRAGLHAFRHSRVHQLRRSGTHEDVQLARLGHSSLQATRGYSHLREDIEFRKAAAAKVSLDLGPLGLPKDAEKPNADSPLKASA